MFQARNAFTLIELLVVITIIVVLLSLLTPALDKALTQAELTVCAVRHRGIAQITTSYAIETPRRKFLSGQRDNDQYEHLPFVPKSFMAYMEKFAGGTKAPAQDDGAVKWGAIPDMLLDPSFSEIFGYTHADYGAVIGYIYLGNHPGIAAANSNDDNYEDWRSPLGVNSRGDGELSVCWNEWTLGLSGNEAVLVGQFSVSAHTEGGGALGTEPPVGGHFYHADSGKDVRELGTIGGNVGFADGSAAWRPVEDMFERIGAATAQGAPDYNYPTLW